MSYQRPDIRTCSCGRRMAYNGVDVHKLDAERKASARAASQPASGQTAVPA